MNTILPGAAIQAMQTPTVNFSSTGSKANAAEMPFKSMFEDAVKSYEELDAVKQSDSIALALGEIDDIAQVNINAQKAEFAFQMLVEMRNKILDSYSEIMRMNV